MKPIGLVFVIINLVLAAAFLGWSAFALREADDAAAKITALQSELDATTSELNTQIAGVRTSFENVKDDLDLSQNDINSKDALIAEQKAQISELMRTNDELTASVASIQSTLGDFDDTIGQVSERAERAEASRAEAVASRDEASDGQVAAEMARKDAEDALITAQNSIADLEVELTSTATKLGQAETLIAIAREQGFTLDTAQVLVSGRVVTVKNDVSPALVAINVGTNDNVAPGMTFEVFSGNEYKGQVRVETVKESISSAILVLSPANASPLRQGDQVTTRL